MINSEFSKSNFMSFKQHSFTKITGLRSMQHIKGAEREVIEAYRSELPHDIWGDSDKLLMWAQKKYNELVNKNYESVMLDEKIVERDRNNVIKNWETIINDNYLCKKNPFLKLKIIRSVISDLLPNNAQLAPIINMKVFNNTVYLVNKTGASFKKSYFKLMREFDNSVDIKTEEINENGVRGKWFSLKVPNWSEAEYKPGFFAKMKEFVSVLSQGSNWCTRSPNNVGRDFMGSDFHIFIDDKGIPQICMAGTDKDRGWFRYVRGNDQYAPLHKKYKNILKSFVERHNLDDAQVGTKEENTLHILDICEC